MELKGSGIEETDAQQETANLYFCESRNCKPKLHFPCFHVFRKKVYSEMAVQSACVCVCVPTYRCNKVCGT